MLEATSMLGARYRRVRSEQDKRPMISGLRESGSIEQDADSVSFLYREDYYDKETENQNMLEITIATQCNGLTDAVTLAFVKEFNKFVKIDWSQHTAPPAP
nr:DnaB-like helicase C-terminal domain-containing protein [Planococcus sp. 107-1]